MSTASPELSAEVAAGRPTRAAFEVSTTSTDTLRASVSVIGPLGATTCPLLTSVIRAHLVAGRRYLRVDLAEARVDDPVVVEAFIEAHSTIAELGGMLVVENATGSLARAMSAAELFVAPPA